jgi:hypothetical protein
MSIVVAHGYSMMYANQSQGTWDDTLSVDVTPLPFQEATYGKIPPSNLTELEQYNSDGDFNTTLIGGAAWDDAWPPVAWTRVGGKSYTWDGTGPGDEWILAPMTEGYLITSADGGIGSPANELLFVGVYPYTKKELLTITPVIDDGDGGTMTSPYFATNKYVCLKGQGVGAQYFWNGTEWRSGVSDYD